MRRAVLLFACACGTASSTDDGTPDGGAQPDAGPQAIELRGACREGERYGLFLVEAQERYSLVDGKVADGVVPASIPEVVRTEGDCRLLKRRNPFCNPACVAGETCDHDGTCIRFPAQQDVGVVSIDGLEKAIRMEPLPPSNGYFDTDVPHPVFAPGAEVRLSTTEGRYGAMELAGFGFELLETDGSAWTVGRGSSLPLSWTAPAAPVRSTIAFRLNIDQHGNSPVSLSCRFEDVGFAEIPASLIGALFDSGVSGFPNGALTRETIDALEVDGGCVELRISSPRRGMVEVAGHTPCNGAGQCPPGQTCDLPTNTCR